MNRKNSKKHHRALLVTLLLPLLLPFSATANLATPEIRLPLGVHVVQPTTLNKGLVDELQVNHLLSFGADLLFFAGSDAPDSLKNWGAGVRFDSLSSFRIYADDRLEVAARLFSLMLQRRWYFEDAYIGPSLTVGIYQPSVINYKRDPSDWIQYTAGRVHGASLAAEAGWIFDIYVVGGELGYQYLTLEEIHDSTGGQLQTTGGQVGHVNLSGPYLKFILGLHF